MHTPQFVGQTRSVLQLIIKTKKIIIKLNETNESKMYGKVNET